MGLHIPALIFRRPSLERVRLDHPRHKANPFPYYARLRAESPVHRVRLHDGREAWLITRYDDAVEAFKNERLLKNKFTALTPNQLRREPWLPPVFRPLLRNMLDMDGFDHARLRARVQKSFTPRIVDGLRPRIQQLADRLVDSLQERPRIDLVRDYALPIPTTVIAELLGVPVEDGHRFHRWSQGIVTATVSTAGLISAVPHAWAFLRYIRQLVARKRHSPGDDLLSALVHGEETDQRLTDDELVAMAFVLLVAGHETTVNVIANGTLALLQHPDQAGRLRQHPELMGSAIEELLRFASPLEMATERYAREDLFIGGTRIPQGAMVLIAVASANRDEQQFERPDELDVGRQPNRHLSFGIGSHYCLGAPLARAEGQIAIETLLRRLPGLQLAVPEDRLNWRRGLLLRGLTKLPCTFNRV